METSRRSWRIEWSSAIWAGVIAGAVFLLLELLLAPAFGMGSPWGPMRMIAAIVLGREALPPPESFDLGVFLAAVSVHLSLSVVYAIALAFLVNRFATGGVSAAVGGAFGLALYLVNFYLFTALFPWFADARTGLTLFAHLVFGAVAGWCYQALQHRAGRIVTVRGPGVPHPV
jgi:hypothetical protein